MEELNSCGSVSNFGTRSWEKMESAIGEFWKACRISARELTRREESINLIESVRRDGMRIKVRADALKRGTYEMGNLICEQLPITKGGRTVPNYEFNV